VIDWIESEEIESPQIAAERLHGYDGILVPGGFGKRGIQGMVHTIQVRARKQDSILWNLPWHAVRHD